MTRAIGFTSRSGRAFTPRKPHRRFPSNAFAYRRGKEEDGGCRAAAAPVFCEVLWVVDEKEDMMVHATISLPLL